jgi:hypothetical protein
LVTRSTIPRKHNFVYILFTTSLKKGIYMNKRLLAFFALLFCIQNISTGQVTVGLQLHHQGSLDSGYVLFAPIANKTTYLIDKCGRQIHSWTSKYAPGLSAYLLADGTLLRTGMVSDTNKFMGGAGVGGMIEKIDWNGNLVWSYRLCDSAQSQHHDIEPLPNGNILAVVWENRSIAEARAAGRRPVNEPMSIWSEKIVELQPVGTHDAIIVWEWKVWDHLAQSYDPAAPNYDSIPLHPELIDINYNSMAIQDWLHFNSVKYNPDLDQIVVSNHNWSELWVIDHSTTTAQAATHTGGKSKKGGDLLYRWGNPATYRKGTIANQKLFRQHDPYWIPKGMPNAGKIMVFNNGLNRPGGLYSSVEMITPPYNAFTASYSKTLPYLPTTQDWVYTAPVKTSFYSSFISGAQMLSNGNVLVCNGNSGDFFEINVSKEKVWEYINPVNNIGPVAQGTKANFSVFRCYFYPNTYSAFNGKNLAPGNPLELNPKPYDCAADTDLNNLTGVAAIPAAAKFTVTNPFSNRLIFKSNARADDMEINLYDITGKLVQQWSHVRTETGETVYFDVTGEIKTGIYMISFQDNNTRYTAKLVKN